MKSAGSALLAVLVLVGVPVGVGLVAHETASQKHLSPKGLEAQQLIAQLQSEGATNITCSWTGSGSVSEISCTGALGRNSNAGVDGYAFGTPSK